MNWATVKEMRRLYSTTSITVRNIEKKFNCPGAAAILKNKRWYDPDYFPPVKTRGIPPKLITIFGESKTIQQWAKDPRCQVKANTITKRLKLGVKGPALLVRKSRQGRPTKE